MQNFQSIVFVWTRTYSEIFKSALMYFQIVRQIVGQLVCKVSYTRYQVPLFLVSETYVWNYEWNKILWTRLYENRPVVWMVCKLNMDTPTAWKVSVFGVFLVRIFPHSDWIRIDTPYFSVFSPNTGKYGLKKLWIRTLFTQCSPQMNFNHYVFHWITSLVWKWCLICNSWSSQQRCSIKNGVLRNFAKFIEKHLYQSFFFNKVTDVFYRTPLDGCFCNS